MDRQNKLWRVKLTAIIVAGVGLLWYIVSAVTVASCIWRNISRGGVTLESVCGEMRLERRN